MGTPRAITKASDNTKVWEWKNDDPFGANLPNENPSGLGAFAFNPRFPGQYYDQETGTHFIWNRDYDPATGRYIQSDPIGLTGGIGTYPYANGNALMYVDPDGKFSLAECIGAALVAYGAYKVWSNYSCQRECQLECNLRFGCATGNCPTEDGDTRALTICTRGCVGKCWSGPGKKGPMGPTPTSPPNNPPITK